MIDTEGRGLDTHRGPPLGVVLAHFLIGLGFLLLGTVVWVAQRVGVVSPVPRAVLLHTILVGWVGLTVMGAMSQFVPVWSGVPLYDVRLMRWQLIGVVPGLLGLLSGLLTGMSAVLAAGGTVLFVGVGLFVFNVGQTLRDARPFDTTEWHFAIALAFLGGAAALGVLMAWRVGGRFEAIPVPRTSLVAAHATVAVFGVLVTAIIGALYQLGPMLTQTDPTAAERRFRWLETRSYPVGVALLAAGRLTDVAVAGRIGGAMTAFGLFATGVSLTGRVLRTRTDRSPTLRWYGVGGIGLCVWAVAGVVPWLTDPLADSAVFGPGRVGSLLALGTIAAIVVGSLYHIVPFLVWVRNYSDRVGLEVVPTVEDLYRSDLATLDLTLFGFGWVAMVLGRSAGGDAAVRFGGLCVAIGVVVLAANLSMTAFGHGIGGERLEGWGLVRD